MSTPDDVGLCAACRHVRVTANRRGSTFYMCGRAAQDRRYPQYPPLPVRHCPGFEAGPSDHGKKTT